MSERNLGNLPPSDDKFWSKADKTLAQPDNKHCDHYFQRVSGRQVECRNCGAGFFIGPSIEVRDGHIYKKDTLVV